MSAEPRVTSSVLTTRRPPDGPHAEADLVARARSGDTRAFEMLVSAHTQTVRRFARGFARNQSDADDIAQEALVKAWLSLRSFRGESAFSTWLFRIVRHVAIDASRSRQGRQRAGERPLLEGAGAVDGAAPADRVLEQDQEAHLVWAALREVPERYRAPLILFDIEGLSYEEVAAVERVPVGTVRSRLSRARDRLRVILERHMRRDEGERAGERSGTGAGDLSSHPVGGSKHGP